MNSKLKIQKKWLSLLILVAFLLLFLLGFAWYTTAAQNISEIKVLPFDISGNVSVNIDDSEQAEKWETTIQRERDSLAKDFYTGATFSCLIVNNNKCEINDWNLRININNDCYLNGFWCGDFEVHQFRNGKEIAELVKNTQTDSTGLSVECNDYSNAFLIHLIPGDYLIYHPSVEAKEDVIKAHNSVGIGFIFYFQEKLDLTDYELTYHNNLKLTDSIYFKIVIIVAILWLLGMVLLHLFSLVNKKYLTEMNNSIKSISIMAELYLEVHMINMNSDTGYLVKGKQDDLLFNFIGTKVSNYFVKYIEEDCKDEYKFELSQFLNFFAINDMMKNSSSISFEYQSVKKGWISLRFFKMENDDKNSQLIFTVRDINDEKIKNSQEHEKLMDAEYSQLIKSNFLNTIRSSINAITGEILTKNQTLENSSKNDADKALCFEIGNLIEQSNLLQDCVYDMLSLEAGDFYLNYQQYNLYELIDKVFDILKPYYTGKNFEIQKAIDIGIPGTLEGDKNRIMKILMLILISAFFITTNGFVKLSLFAKRKDDVEELLFSIRNTGTGFTEEQMNEINSFLKGSRINSFDNPSLVYLKIINGILKEMGSELKIVSTYGSDTEFYFTIKQKIVGKE